MTCSIPLVLQALGAQHKHDQEPHHITDPLKGKYELSKLHDEFFDFAVDAFRLRIF